MKIPIVVLALCGAGRVALAAPCCPEDTDNNAWVGVDDLTNVILDWATDGSAHNADVDGSGLVDVNDLTAVITAWGETCPHYAWEYEIINAASSATSGSCTADWLVRVTNIGNAAAPGSCGRTTICLSCSENNWQTGCYLPLTFPVPPLDPNETYTYTVNNFCLFGAQPGTQRIKAGINEFGGCEDQCESGHQFTCRSITIY